MDTVLEYLREWLPEVVGAIAIIVVARILIRLAVRGLERILARRDVEASAVRFLVSVAKVAFWLVVLVAVLGLFGFPTTSFVAVLGAFGLAIGLALQDVIGNFASGIMILVLKPFVADEYVQVAGLEGTVKSVEIFSTTLLTPDNKRVTIPNGQITSEAITNYSREGIRRVDLVFGIAYGDDLRVARSVLEEMAAADGRVLAEPAPMFPVLSLGDSSVNLAARPWVRSEDYWPLYWDWTERVKLRFDERGISIPFPQRDIHYRPVPVDAETGQTGPVPEPGS